MGGGEVDDAGMKDGVQVPFFAIGLWERGFMEGVSGERGGREERRLRRDVGWGAASVLGQRSEVDVKILWRGRHHKAWRQTSAASVSHSGA